jgi:4-amino-4-deoxy-L-arabinose transferase-like glycosyltransferase
VLVSVFAAALALSWTVILRCPSYGRSTLDWDESLYLLIAQRWSAGGLPYIDIWDHKPPGLYAAFQLARLLFGSSVMAPRLLVTLLIAGSAWLLYGLVRRVLPRSRDGLAVVLLYPAYTLTMSGLSANAEHFFIFANLVGLTYLVRAHDLPRGSAYLRVLFAAGLSFGVALQFKYLALFEAAYLTCCFAGYEVQARKLSPRQLLTPLMVIAFAALLPTLLAFAYFALHDAGAEFVYANFIANARHAASSSKFVELVLLWLRKTRTWLSATGPLLFACALGLWLNRHIRFRRPCGVRLLVLGWVLIGLVEAAATKRFYGHYYLVTVAPLCLLTVLSLAPALTATRGATLLIAVTLTLIPAVTTVKNTYRPWRDERVDEPQRVSQIVQAAMASGDSLHVLDDQPIIYFLSQARPVTRYVFPPLLMTEHFSAVAGIDYREEFAKILAQQPRCLVMRKQGNDRARAFRDLVSSNYRPRGSTEHVDVLCR